jgi:hypothetical protein
MAYLMILNNCKKVIALGAFLTTVFCLITESSYARTKVDYSGKETNGSKISFQIDPEIPDHNNRIYRGFFPQAIQNIHSIVRVEEGNLQQEVGFKSGDLKASKINNRDLYRFSLEDSYRDGVKYEANFNTSPDNVTVSNLEDTVNDNQINRPLTNSELKDFKLKIFVPRTSANGDLINSLSDFSNLEESCQEIKVYFGFPKNNNTKNWVLKPKNCIQEEQQEEQQEDEEN